MSEHNSLLCGGQLHDNLFLILSQLSSTLPSWYLTVHSSATNMTKGWSKWQSVFAVAHGNRQLHKQNSYRCMCISYSNINLCLYTLYILYMLTQISAACFPWKQYHIWMIRLHPPRAIPETMLLLWQSRVGIEQSHVFNIYWRIDQTNLKRGVLCLQCNVFWICIQWQGHKACWNQTKVA